MIADTYPRSHCRQHRVTETFFDPVHMIENLSNTIGGTMQFVCGLDRFELPLVGRMVLR